MFYLPEGIPCESRVRGWVDLEVKRVEEGRSKRGAALRTRATWLSRATARKDIEKDAG